jgi:hypothetical protein
LICLSKTTQSLKLCGDLKDMKWRHQLILFNLHSVHHVVYSSLFLTSLHLIYKLLVSPFPYLAYTPFTTHTILPFSLASTYHFIFVTRRLDRLNLLFKWSWKSLGKVGHAKAVLSFACLVAWFDWVNKFFEWSSTTATYAAFRFEISQLFNFTSLFIVNYITMFFPGHVAYRSDGPTISSRLL